MSLIIPATINGSLRRIALYEISDRPAPYYHELISFGPVKVSGASRTGGYIRPQFGSATIMAEAFSGDIPPDTVTLPSYLVTSDGDVLIAESVGQLSDILPYGASYELYGDDYSDEVSSGATTALLTYFGNACTTLGLALDSSLATDYDVIFTLADSRLLIDVLDEMAEYCCHGFYIHDGTMYLIDMAQDNGTVELDSRFDFFDDEVSYEAATPYSIYKGGAYAVTGTYPHGSEYTQSTLYHTGQAYIEAQLTRKKTLLDKWWITFNLPIGTNDISYGQKISFDDYSKYIPLRVDMWAREFNYTLETSMEKMTISGEGVVSAKN